MIFYPGMSGNDQFLSHTDFGQRIFYAVDLNASKISYPENKQKPENSIRHRLKTPLTSMVSICATDWIHGPAGV